jgi:hypothetical protein
VRDDQRGRFRPGDASAILTAVCARPAFLIDAVHAAPGGFDVRFNRAVATASAVPANFQIRRGGDMLPIATAMLVDSVTVALRVDPGNPLRGRGEPYAVRAEPGVRAADGDPLARAEIEFLVRVAGTGAATVYAAPNPAGPSDNAVSFVDAGVATRVFIYNLEGQLVRELSGATDGALRWDLRDRAGARVSGGVYVFVARDGTGTRQGRLVVAR